MKIVTFGTRELVDFGKSLYMRLVRIMAFTVLLKRLSPGQMKNLVHPNVSYPDASDTGTSLYRAPSARVPMAKKLGNWGI